VLLPGGEEHRVAGERVTVVRDGVAVATRRLSWLQRGVRALVHRARARRLVRRGR
jgi:hypothetical protein